MEKEARSDGTVVVAGTTSHKMIRYRQGAIGYVDCKEYGGGGMGA